MPLDDIEGRFRNASGHRRLRNRRLAPHFRAKRKHTSKIPSDLGQHSRT